MKALKIFLLVDAIILASAFIWVGLLYRTYGMQTLLYLLQSPPDIILSYSKNMFNPPAGSSVTGDDSVKVNGVTQNGTNSELPATPIVIPSKHMITVMSHMYQKLNNCGPSSAAMAASTLGVNFDQFLAADVLKGSGTDKNVSPEELVAFLETQGLRAIYRVNGNRSDVEQLVAQNIPVIVEQWLVKRGSGEYVGHYRVVRGYDQSKQIFTTNDSFNGPNFVIPYSQFDEWWRPFNRGYLVVYKPEQEEIVTNILGSDRDETKNLQAALEKSQAETESVGDGYAYFNVGTNATLLQNYPLAVSAYDQALQKTFPKDFLWYQFGHLDAYAQQGQYDRVLRLTDTLFSQAGEVEEARYYRGVVYAKQGKKAEAKAEFEKALQANPRYHRAATALEQL